jgi:hypothetical protein
MLLALLYHVRFRKFTKIFMLRTNTVNEGFDIVKKLYKKYEIKIKHIKIPKSQTKTDTRAQRVS